MRRVADRIALMESRRVLAMEVRCKGAVVFRVVEFDETAKRLLVRLCDDVRLSSKPYDEGGAHQRLFDVHVDIHTGEPLVP